MQPFGQDASPAQFGTSPSGVPQYGATQFGAPPYGPAQYGAPQTGAQPFGGQQFPGQPFGGQQYGAQQFPGAAPSPQAAPVSPVACPAYVPPSGAQTQGQSQAQSIQQAYARQMQAVARSLEQMIPGVQIMISVLQEVLGSPRGQTLAGANTLVSALREVVFQHFAALGAIRRFLCGEATPQVLTALSVAMNQLTRLQAQARPLVERIVMGASPELRGTVSSLSQTVTAADTLASQAANMVRGMVGQQIWDAASTQVAPTQVAGAAGGGTTDGSTTATATGSDQTGGAGTQDS